LTRRLVHTYCDQQQPGWMDAVDGTIGHRLPALVSRSPLQVRQVHAQVLLEQAFAPWALGFMLAKGAVAVAAKSGRFTTAELDTWLASLQVASAPATTCSASTTTSWWPPKSPGMAPTRPVDRHSSLVIEEHSPMYPLVHKKPATAAGRPGGLAPRGWRRLLGALLGCLLTAACGSPTGRQPTATSQQASAGSTHRDYWPTAGWRTTAPNQQGMDPQVLGDLDTQIPQRYPQVRSLLVVRHGYLVYEHYWQGRTANDGDNLYSVTKSVVSALVGIALGEGKLKGLDQPIGVLLARHLPKDADPRLGRVTLEQLLTMTSGLAGDDPSLGGDPRISQRQGASRDWVGHILGRRLVTSPGSGFAYSSATSQLLSAIVADATGQSTLAFARARLFGPLGIASAKAPAPVFVAHPSPATLQAYARAPVAWPTDPQGYQLGFSGLKLPSRDLAKVGYLYLNGGRWDTTQVIPAGYVAASTRPHSTPPPDGPAEAYGYQWWVTSQGGHPSFLAVGYGGQLVQVVPDLDLVVVITSDASQNRNDAGALVGQAIIPAIND
jgi:CubicO group peptidase (beta-lactamase class C family)